MDLTSLYKKYTGREPEAVKALTPSGSARRYYRLFGDPTLVGVKGVNRDENEAFIYLSDHFASRGINVPRVLARSEYEYLLTDLGDVSLFDRLDDKELLCEAMRGLVRMHYIGSKGLDYSRCFPVEAFDEQAVLWDLNYFKYCWLGISGVQYSEPRLQADFDRLAVDVARITRERGVFMYRDFQSRNVMVHDGQPWFIDFQGGRRGPAAYDVVSFIYQAKAGYGDATRRLLIDAYLDEASRLGGVSEGEFEADLRLMALIRALQTLGAYGFRGKVEGKAHFLQSIRPALDNLRHILSVDYERYPYLMQVLREMLGVCAGMYPYEPTLEGLTVRVSSFSYKKGIPEDYSGNGGGFVFDCRAMDNPGRYAEYKPLTGLDRPVIEFLESRGEIQRFLKAVWQLTDAAVANYRERGFTSLMVSFGCTGGRHRSVYSAQHTAEHIKQLFPDVNVILNHREQRINRTL